jgi:hypothetical protein
MEDAGQQEIGKKENNMGKKGTDKNECEDKDGRAEAML